MLVQIAYIILHITAYEVVKKVYDQPVPKTTRSEIKMVIKKGGQERVRELLSMSKNEGDVRKVVIKFLEPADVRGVVFLQIVEGDKTVQYLYLPSLKRVRRIGGRDRKRPFMGSEFTYEDLERKNPDDFEHKFVKVDEKYWVVESVPKKGVDTQYSKSIAWIRKDNLVVEKTELYKDGELFKVVEVKKVEKIKDFWIPMITVVRNVKNSNKTIMEVEKIEIDVSIPEKYFRRLWMGKW